MFNVEGSSDPNAQAGRCIGDNDAYAEGTGKHRLSYDNRLGLAPSIHAFDPDDWHAEDRMQRQANETATTSAPFIATLF